MNHLNEIKRMQTAVFQNKAVKQAIVKWEPMSLIWEKEIQTHIKKILEKQ